MCNPESLADKRRRRDALRKRLNTKAAYPGRDEELEIVRNLDAEIAVREQRLTEIKMGG